MRLFLCVGETRKLLAQPQWASLKQDWQQTLKIGTPAALSNAMNPLSGAILMMLLSSHGTAAVAAYGAAQRIESILILVLMSLTSALTPFMAQNLGQKSSARFLWFVSQHAFCSGFPRVYLLDDGAIEHSFSGVIFTRRNCEESALALSTRGSI